MKKISATVAAYVLSTMVVGAATVSLSGEVQAQEPANANKIDYDHADYYTLLKQAFVGNPMQMHIRMRELQVKADAIYEDKSAEAQLEGFNIREAAEKLAKELIVEGKADILLRLDRFFSRGGDRPRIFSHPDKNGDFANLNQPFGHGWSSDTVPALIAAVLQAQPEKRQAFVAAVKAAAERLKGDDVADKANESRIKKVNAIAARDKDQDNVRFPDLGYGAQYFVRRAGDYLAALPDRIPTHTKGPILLISGHLVKKEPS